MTEIRLMLQDKNINTSVIKGLSEIDALKLIERYGENKINVTKKINPLSLLITQFANLITVILFAAGVFSLYIREFIDALFIFLILVFNAFLGFIQEYRAEKALVKLRDYVASMVRVFRGGKEKEVEAVKLVPGDCVILSEGNKVPADGKLFSSIPIEVDESILTGESLSVQKKAGDTLFMGTYITRGRGEMIIENTGYSTRLGKIAEKLSKIERPKTPLSRNLDTLSKYISFAIIFLLILLIPVGVIQGRDVNEFFLTLVSLAVAVVPEGLPLVVTVALAVGAYRMAKQKAIVRKMIAIETLGTANVILSDKTGTITQNKMVVKDHWLPKKSKQALLLASCVIGNTASILLEEKDGEPEVLGDATDGALLSFAKKHGVDKAVIEIQGKILEESPFDPFKKTIEVRWKDSSGEYLLVRGAPETIFKDIDEEERREGELKLESFAKKGLRVIGFGYKTKKDQKLQLLGLMGLYDPPREESFRAVDEARKAGVRVVMVTGDNPVTALAIAEEIKLIEKGELVLTSSDIEKLSDEKLSEMLLRVRVFARMTPQDKLRVVKMYRDLGYVVGVTGDGVNDALALAEAHIGISMGKTGTDVAKEAGDIIVTDDNLYTIIKAIEEGRGIYRNIVKVVTYLLSANIAEFLLVVLCLFLGLPLPLFPTQILWINLVTDGIPAIALASDKNKKGLLSSGPRNTRDGILNRDRILVILLISIVITSILFFVFIYLAARTEVSQARFVIFNLFVILELMVVFVIRGGIFPLNKFLILTIVISLLLHVAMLLNPVTRGIFL
ncbi:cation-translocating P-type ATPase [Candidatus Parcubacteria bacterium]|nr:MAG: cation-translocating P-type ATPase [Candidatus Parcubacteria bacterium]